MFLIPIEVGKMHTEISVTQQMKTKMVKANWEVSGYSGYGCQNPVIKIVSLFPL